MANLRRKLSVTQGLSPFCCKIICRSPSMSLCRHSGFSCNSFWAFNSKSLDSVHTYGELMLQTDDDPSSCPNWGSVVKKQSDDIFQNRTLNSSEIPIQQSLVQNTMTHGLGLLSYTIRSLSYHIFFLACLYSGRAYFRGCLLSGTFDNNFCFQR